MSPVRNSSVIFKEVPTGFPEPGKHTQLDTSATIDLDNVPLEGGILVKTLILSTDPYLRGRMRDSGKDTYNQPFELGKP